MPGSMFHHPSAMMLLTQLQQLEHRLVAKLEESVEMMRAASTSSTSLPPPPALERQQAMCSEDDDAMTEVLTQELPAYDDDNAHDEEEKCPNQNGEEEYKRCDVELPRPKRQRFQTSHFMFNAE